MMALVPRSELKDVVWPTLVSGSRASALAVLAQLLETQWWPAARLREYQLKQAERLIAFAVRQVEHVRESAKQAGWREGQALTEEHWRRWPILTRQRARQLGEGLFADQPPTSHGKITKDATSGSTGQPLQVRRTMLSQFMYSAMGLREMLWHQRDVTRTYALIKHVPGVNAAYPDGARLKNWGGAVADIYNTGPAMVLDIKKTSIEQQADWLRRVQPGYLNTFPSALEGMVDEFKRRGWPPPPLTAVRTQGEVVTPALRKKVRDIWGVPITNSYSAEETGYMANQAPDGEHLLVTAETCIVEVVDDHDQPCEPGEVGRVIVTSLHNFAMPLIRYEIGDHAQVGPPSPCGRGLPVLQRVLGRSRSRIRLPDGSRRFAYNPSDVFAAVACVRQYQIVQTKIDRLAVNLVADRELEKDEARRLEAGLADALGHTFAVEWHYVASIHPPGVVKRQDVVSELA